MSDSPTRPLWTAIGALIDAGVDPPLNSAGQPILDRVDAAGRIWPRWYRGRTEPNPDEELPPPGYFLLGQADEVEVGSNNGERSQAGRYRLHCWAASPDEAEQLYRWLKGLLQDRTLEVAGYQPVTGRLSKTGPRPDQTQTAWQVLADYEAEADEPSPVDG